MNTTTREPILHCDPCPKCGAEMAAEPIPVARLSLYGGEDGKPMDCQRGCGRPAHFSHLMGRVENDRVVSWSCPFCQASWPRG